MTVNAGITYKENKNIKMVRKRITPQLQTTSVNTSRNVAGQPASKAQEAIDRVVAKYENLSSKMSAKDLDAVIKQTVRHAKVSKQKKKKNKPKKTQTMAKKQKPKRKYIQNKTYCRLANRKQLGYKDYKRRS